MEINVIKQILLEKLVCRSENDLEEYLRIINENINSTLIGGEKHHILPACLFPQYSNLKDHQWNMVKLTCRDHIRAHFHLGRAFGGKMNTALYMIVNMRTDQKLTEEIIQAYEIARKEHSSIMKIQGKQNVKNMHTPESRAKMRATKNTLESKTKSSLIEKNKFKEGTHNFQRPEVRTKQIAATVVYIKSERSHTNSKEHSDRIIKRNLENNPAKTEKARRASADRGKTKWADSTKNPNNNPANREAARLRKLKYWEEVSITTCPYCQLTSKSKGLMTRYHFDNCKIKDR